MGKSPESRPSDECFRVIQTALHSFLEVLATMSLFTQSAKRPHHCPSDNRICVGEATDERGENALVAPDGELNECLHASQPDVRITVVEACEQEGSDANVALLCKIFETLASSFPNVLGTVEQTCGYGGAYFSAAFACNARQPCQRCQPDVFIGVRQVGRHYCHELFVSAGSHLAKRPQRCCSYTPSNVCQTSAQSSEATWVARLCQVNQCLDRCFPHVRFCVVEPSQGRSNRVFVASPWNLTEAKSRSEPDVWFVILQTLGKSGDGSQVAVVCHLSDELYSCSPHVRNAVNKARRHSTDD